MAAPNFLSDLFEINYDQFDECEGPLLPHSCRGISKKKNRCAWLKLGKHECCGKPCEDAYCGKHTEMRKSGCRQPLPCVVCCIGVKNFEFICKKCRREKGKRQLGQVLAQRFENNEDWHNVKSSLGVDD